MSADERGVNSAIEALNRDGSIFYGVALKQDVVR